MLVPRAWCVRSASAINCFNLEHPCLVRFRWDRVSRPRILYGFRVRRTPWRSCLPTDVRSSTQCFHDTGVALVDWRFGVCFSPRAWRRFIPPRSSSIEPVTRLSRRADVPAYESLRIGPHTLATPRPLRSETREDLTSLRSGTPSIEWCTSSTDTLRYLPRWMVNLVPHPASSLGFGGFAATGPCATPLRLDDAVLLFANTVVSARPPFTSADRFDADASLGQTQPFDFCNEFSITTHEHITRERCPHPT